AQSALLAEGIRHFDDGDLGLWQVGQGRHGAFPRGDRWPPALWGKNDNAKAGVAVEVATRRNRRQTESSFFLLACRAHAAIRKMSINSTTARLVKPPLIVRGVPRTLASGPYDFAQPHSASTSAHARLSPV